MQRSHLKPRPSGSGRYDPAPLLEVDALELDERGCVGLLGAERVVDLHHVDHPDSRNRRLVNGLSILPQAHYARMRSRYGAHLVDGVAGENVLLATAGPLTAAELAGELLLEVEGGVLAVTGVMAAPPCVEFSRFALGRDDLEIDDEARAALEDLDRGSAVSTCAPSAPVGWCLAPAFCAPDQAVHVVSVGSGPRPRSPPQGRPSRAQSIRRTVPSIEAVGAREILDSRGNPTIEVEVALDDGTLARAAVPSGASTGAYEAVELRDGGDRYAGKGVQQAVAYVLDTIGPELIGTEASEQRIIDQALIDLDGTPDKRRLRRQRDPRGEPRGRPRRRRVARPAAVPLPRRPQRDLLPVPMMNILNGGARRHQRRHPGVHGCADRCRDLLRGGPDGR